MSLKLRVWLTAATFAVLLPALSAAQQTESRIVGKVLDQSKAALPGVTVTATSKDTGARAHRRDRRRRRLHHHQPATGHV